MSYIIIVAHRKSKPLPRSCGGSLQFGSIHADLTHPTEITLQDVPDREYTLRLFVENEEIKLQKTANRSWTPAKRQYAIYFLSLDTPNGCTCAGISHRSPRCVRRSKRGQAIPIGRRIDRMTWSSTLKGLSKSIGAPPSASSEYPVC